MLLIATNDRYLQSGYHKMAASMDSFSKIYSKNNLDDFASSCGIRQERLEQPFVMRNATRLWPCRTWTVCGLADSFNNKKLKFRIGLRSTEPGSVLWEGLCHYEEAYLSDFHDWCMATPGEVSTDNPLHRYRSDLYWCYADYKYMRDLFPGQKDILEAVRWDYFGLKDFSGEQSTLWIGSAGAHTVCHQDSYGFNLVAQIQGRKKWYLFPPEQTEYLYPTRIPYEESSVFSAVNITRPDMSQHPKYRHATPFPVTLEPGDVLYVPKQWWHFVECLETSISINCWVELPTDDYSRVQESIVRLLVCRLLDEPEESSIAPRWLNPTETITSHETNLLYLEKTLDVIKRPSRNTEDAARKRTNQEQGPQTVKRISIESPLDSDIHSLPPSGTPLSSVSSGDGINEDNYIDEEGNIQITEQKAIGETKHCHTAKDCSISSQQKSTTVVKDSVCAAFTGVTGQADYVTERSVHGRDSSMQHDFPIPGRNASKFEICAVHPVTMETIINRKQLDDHSEDDSADIEKNTLMEMLVQSVTDPRVITLVTEILLARVRGSQP